MNKRKLYGFFDACCNTNAQKMGQVSFNHCLGLGVNCEKGMPIVNQSKLGFLQKLWHGM
jgi:hypothetical protein